MKRTIIISTAAILLSFLLSLSTSFASEGRKKQNRPAPRGQWTEQQAWDWEKKIGEIRAHLQSSVFKLSKDLIDSIHEEGIVAYTS